MKNLNIFSAFRLLEKISAYAQGKGYGAGTIRQEVSAAFKKLPVAPKLAIDVGGNVGKYSQELRHRYAGLEIHVFEPASVNVKKLRELFKGDSLVTINACGVSNSIGAATLFSDAAGSGLGSLTKRRLDHFGIDFNVKETIDLIRFEDYWRSNLNSRVVDLVKLDIEGPELEALKSFGAALPATRVIQFEFGGCNIDTKTYFQDFYYFFKENNFSLFRITPFGLQSVGDYLEIDEVFATTNYVAVHNKPG